MIVDLKERGPKKGGVISLEAYRGKKYNRYGLETQKPIFSMVSWYIRGDSGLSFLRDYTSSNIMAVTKRLRQDHRPQQ